MGNENENNEIAGTVKPLASSLVYQVADENGELINCQTLNEALIFSYLVKIWTKLNGTKEQ